MRFSGVCTLLFLGIPLAAAQKPIDYFKKGIVPPYPLSGTLEVTVSHDDHFSSTVGGTTYSFHCSSTTDNVDCAEGEGVYYDLTLSDGSSIHLGNMYIGMGDPWSGGEDVIHTAKIEFKEKGVGTTDQAFHMRWRDITVQTLGLGDTVMVPHALCIQVPGTESIPDGKERKEYGKHHRLEACYFAILSNGPLEPASVRLTRIKALAAAGRDIKP